MLLKKYLDFEFFQNISSQHLFKITEKVNSHI